MKELGSEVVEEVLTPADYVISGDCGIERKEFNDFSRSVFDGRLFEQTERLAGAYKRTVLVVKGGRCAWLVRGFKPKVFWGALAKVMAKHGLSVIFTPNEEHTAVFLHSLARKLQEEEKRHVITKRRPRTYTLAQRQILAVQSLPHIGPERAKKLLEKSGALRMFSRPRREFLPREGARKETA